LSSGVQITPLPLSLEPSRLLMKIKDAKQKFSFVLKFDSPLANNLHLGLGIFFFERPVD
jgi:hypothetical protein